MGKIKSVVMLAVLAVVWCGFSEPVSGQDHHVAAIQSCSGPQSLGGFLECEGPVFNADGFNDSYEINEAYFMSNENQPNEFRTPAAGDAAIEAITGNAICAGQDCNPATAAGCSLPCLIGPALCVANGLPGSPIPGSVRFSTGSMHSIQQQDLDENNLILTRMWVTVISLCNGQSNCEDPEICCDGISESNCYAEPQTMTSLMGVTGVNGPVAQCPADVNLDGTVDAADLGELLAAWGSNLGHPADLNQDGTVAADDLSWLLADWGACM